MRKEIVLGFGILILLLMLTVIGSARFAYQSDCSYCHDDYPRPLTAKGVLFNDTHKFNGVNRPSSGDSCDQCHLDPSNAVAGNFTLTKSGPYYNDTHRYNATTLGSKLFSSPGCANCHVDVVSANFTLISGTATYLTSTLCKNCHRAKYENWTNNMHRVMLTKNTSGASMNLTVPDGLNWSTTNVSYMIVGKTSFRYLNETGYFFSQYFVENQTFGSYGPSKYSCGSCHTTGYNSSAGNQSNLSGIVGSWSEEGIGCENCHGAGGNGHHVTVYTKGEDCIRCHNGSTRQGAAMTNKHATAPAEESLSSSCTFCHSPYDTYKSGAASSLGSAANVTCLVCHNPHNTTDDIYGPLFTANGFDANSMANVADPKLSFFNGTASNASRQAHLNSSLITGNDVYDTLTTPALLYPGSISSRKDSNYGTGAINVTGPVSEVLCSLCHYRHGLEHIASVNMTHGRNNANTSEWATCIDCHMSNAGSLTDHSFSAESATNYPDKSCSKGTNCHVTSTQNTSLSNISLVPAISEWEESLHNDKVNGEFYVNATEFEASTRDNSSCSKCHSPFNWNPANESDVVAAEDYRGVTCAVCHNTHDMGASITNSGGKKYSWYNRDAVFSGTRYKANYTLMADTIELCGNCHANIRSGRDAPGWSTSTTPIRPHGFPAKDIFVGSWKESSTLNFECIDCHMYINKTNGTGGIVSDAEKVSGHSFAVNETGLQNASACSGCHDGTNFDTIPALIDEIQTDTHNRWNTTNTTVQNALATINAYTSQKNQSRDKIALAYWKLRNVDADASWGVHDPVGTKKLLDDASALAIAANASLGQGNTTVQLYAGWNLKSLNETPSDTTPISVMSSVSNNLTVVWGYNSTSKTWLIYDPAGPSGLNTLTGMVRNEGYWIRVANDSVWVV